MNSRGLIWQTYMISCGKCSREEPLPDRLFREAAKRAEATGWAYTDSDGWLCAHCLPLVLSSPLNTETIRAEIGARIRGVRTAKGIKQASLARYVGLGRSSIANMETGRQTISFEMLARIARALQCPAADLLPESMRGAPDEP